MLACLRGFMERILRSQLYAAPQSTYHVADLCVQYNARRFTIPTELPGVARDVTCLVLPARQSGQPSDVVFMYSHANGEDLADAAFVGDQIRRAFYVDVVVYEYTSYGSAELRQGLQPSERALYSDSITVAREIKRQYPNASIVSIGRSLGGAMAVHAARALGARCAALILLSAFSSVFAVKLSGVALKMAHSLDLYRVEDDIRGVQPTCALLVMHGDQDTLVPPRLAHVIYNASTAPEHNKKLVIIRGADHNSTVDPAADWPKVVETIGDFLRYHTILK
jgi:pimeloyl-ACP methyl ester carboxylesterase